jgi:hypothetical protein
VRQSFARWSAVLKHLLKFILMVSAGPQIDGVGGGATPHPIHAVDFTSIALPAGLEQPGDGAVDSSSICRIRDEYP